MKFLILLTLLIPALAFGQVKDVAPGIYSQGFNSEVNYVKNPNCFANVNNITASGGSLTRTTSTTVAGSASCLVDASATSQTYKWALNTFDNGLKGQNCEARFKYTGDASLYQAYVERNSLIVSNTVTLEDATSAGAVAYGRTVSIPFPCGDNSNSTFVTIIATSNSAAAIKVGQVYAGELTSITSVRPQDTFSAKVSASGVVSAENYDFINGNCSLSTATFTCTFNTGIFTVAPNCVIVGTGGNMNSNNVTTQSSTQLVYISATSGANSASAVNIICQKQGADAPIASAINATQTNYDWVSYTPTFTGFGTVSVFDCWHKRDGADLLLRCKFTSGTSTATEARVSLPNSLFPDSVRTTAIQICGDVAWSASTITQAVHVLCEPSNSYVTFALSNSGGLGKINGSSFSTAGQIVSFMARVPGISGWVENMKAPTLVGSVTSASSLPERLERAAITISGGVPTIGAQSGTWISSLTDNSAGNTSLNLTAGMFSSAPTCTVTGQGDNGRIYVSAVSTSIVTIVSKDAAGSALDVSFNVVCMGPR